VRRFVIVGQKATASSDFLLDDVPGTSGRLDVLVRCVRAALLASHGVRRDTVVYLVLLGGPRAPRVVRVLGKDVQFLRPDERSLAVLFKKVLASHEDEARDPAAPFAEVRPGISVARGGIEVVVNDCNDARVFVLDEGGTDMRDEADLDTDDLLFVIGDHLGLTDDVVGALAARAPRRIRVGPTSIHADDVVAVVVNEVDRRRCR
jgi:tRNA (pseudouridine54-N1)-methyltransferase